MVKSWKALALLGFLSVNCALAPEPSSAADNNNVTITELNNLQNDIINHFREIEKISKNEEIISTAKKYANSGIHNLINKDYINASRNAKKLKVVYLNVQSYFEVKIVARKNVPTGITRVPDNLANVENFYLIVEALNSDGQAVQTEILSDETGNSEIVHMWGQRVSEELYRRVKEDKINDGRVENSTLGTKHRGDMDISWRNGVLTGAVTNW